MFARPGERWAEGEGTYERGDEHPHGCQANQVRAVVSTAEQKDAAGHSLPAIVLKVVLRRVPRRVNAAIAATAISAVLGLELLNLRDVFMASDLTWRATMQSSTTTVASAGVATDETDRLISSDKVVGTAVYNLQGAHLGSVYNLMVDKVSGQVAYAVMSFGGFLGIGESYHPLPWRVLKYDIRQGGYVVDLDQRRLEGAPSYTASTLPDWSDRTYGHRVDDYYGVPPYSF
jgi:PRC-barrel domain